MKKIISIMFVILLVLLTVIPNAFSADDVTGEYSFFVSIYNDTNCTYPVLNTKITVEKNTTVLETLNLLKKQELIVGYYINDNELKRIVVNDTNGNKTIPATETTIFYTKLNGKKQASEGVSRTIENGDIIEWIYGDVSNEVYIPETTNNIVKTQVKPLTTPWTQDVQRIMANSCEFLTLNQGTSNFYIVALGCAGKSADVKMVNSLLCNIRQTQTYEAPTAISKNILSLTFCGYNASELVSQLAMYPNITQQGIFGSINALIAYDSKQYDVPADQVNSRDKLINIILSNQRETGGFGINANSKDDLDTTAMAITALSPYIDRSDVKIVIDKAVAFLVQNQTKTGGFGFMGQESSESLSQVIIALSSIGIPVDDVRFINKKENLLDQLLKYKNDDGGFSHIKGNASASMPTEQAVIALSAIKQYDNPYKMNKAICLMPKIKSETIADVVLDHPLMTFGCIALVLIIVLIVVTISLKTKLKNENR